MQHWQTIREQQNATGQRIPAPLAAGKEAVSFADNRPQAALQMKLVAGMQAKQPSVFPLQKKENQTGLPDNLKNGIENLSGISMNDVRVHYHSPKPATVQAHAYAQGTDIHIAPGQEKHLPHEAWHVVQQKQGRVKATRQLKSKISINDDKGLEQEADMMGAKALSAQMVQRQHAAGRTTTVSNASAPLQAVWIIRNGAWVWENDPYVLQPGESYPPAFAQNPSVLVNKGTEQVGFNASGAESVTKRARPIPNHDELQDVRKKQGAVLRARLKKDPKLIKKRSGTLLSLTSKLEKQAGSSVPKTHQKLIKNRLKKPEVTGDDFRSVIKSQDEFTQSEGTAAFIRGLREPGGDTPIIHRPDLDDYVENSLRLMSSLRTTTQSVVAPVNYKGKVQGMQHPTSQDQPVLEEGSSGHSFADRNRVDAQNLAFESASADSTADPNNVFLASVLSSLVTTLSTMSAPHHASNLPDFNPSRKDKQAEERQRVKDMTNTLAEHLGIPVNTGAQDFDDPWQSYTTPTSPRRQSSKDPRLKPPQPVTSTTTPVVNNTGVTPLIAPPTLAPQQPARQPIKEVQQGVLQVQATAQDLLQVIPAGPLNDGQDVNRQAFRHYIQQVYLAAGAVDVTLPQNEAILNNLHGYMNDIFIHFRHLVQRRQLVQPGGDPLNEGTRLPALEQFFAECGQMAAHNALVLVNYPDIAQQNHAQALGNEQDLGNLGNFDNFITENEVRQMLAQARNVNIPVIGDMAQAAGLANLVNRAANNDYNALFQLLNFNLSPAESNGARFINYFIQGHINQLVMIVNTNSHVIGKKSGYHWITVRVTRQMNGQLAIEYLDSLNAPANYQQMFQALRQMLGQAPQQQQPQQQGPGQAPNGSLPPGNKGSVI